jgi:tyrosine-protein phosphatase SIW14
LINHFFRYALSIFIGVMIFVAPVVYAAKRSTTVRNLRVVESGVLYRSGSMSLSALARTLDEYRIRTVVSFRPTKSERDQTPEVAEIEEEAYCRKLGINYFRLEPKIWDSEDSKIPPPVQVNVDALLKIMDDPNNRPILVHCFAGVHRTGAYCAIFRMEYHNWSSAEALSELEKLGYANLGKEDDVRGYLQNYVPRSRRKK